CFCSAGSADRSITQLMSSWRDTHHTAMRRFAIALAALAMSFAGPRIAAAQTDGFDKLVVFMVPRLPPTAKSQ
ncbi:MAG: hypothetical protein WB611_29080, partial [Stellaceae bacterium]